MSATVLVIAAEKGGVGKTTLSTNLAAILAKNNKRVLVVDCDKQANLSYFYFEKRAVLDYHKLNTIASVFDTNLDPEPQQIIHQTKFDNVFVAPTNTQHMKRHCLPEQMWDDQTQFCLRDFIDEVTDSFDFVVIDTHPDLDTLPTWAALLAAHYVITPLQPETDSGHSAATGEQRIHAAIADANPSLCFLGYVINMLDKRRTMHKKMEGFFRQAYGSQIFKTVIRDLGAFSEARFANLPVIQHAPRSDAAKLITALGEELIARIATTDPLQMQKAA